MANKDWQEEDKKYLKAIEGVRIPDATLCDVPYISPKSLNDFNEIPNQEGGCYWIWTNEPVLHTLHKHPTPMSFNNGEVIYNGIAKDNVRGRVIHHLLGEVDAGWSGISLDIYFGKTVSHRKKALSDKGKVPYLKGMKICKRANKKKNLKRGDEIEIFLPIRNKDDISKLYLSQSEKDHLYNIGIEDKIYFRNGIDITDEKHKGFEFRVYYITGLSSLYLEFIEKKWREDNNWLPKLCSYSSGR